MNLVLTAFLLCMQSRMLRREWQAAPVKGSPREGQPWELLFPRSGFCTPLPMRPQAASTLTLQIPWEPAGNVLFCFTDGGTDTQQITVEPRRVVRLPGV